jgi:hypothetical protein
VMGDEEKQCWELLFDCLGILFSRFLILFVLLPIDKHHMQTFIKNVIY